MRIDYSEPKKSYVSAPVTGRSRKEPTGLFTTILVVTGLITFVAGFGTGWFFSQKAAKKSFQAATEQTSLENAPKKEAAPPPKPAQPVEPAPQAQAQPDPATPQQVQSPQGAGGTPAEQPLSFYKTLPAAQKNNALGSGINSKSEKGKQPLQAAIPANVIKPQAVEPQKNPVDKQATPEKASANAGFTVQVAAFPLKSEAETLKNKLSGKGYNVFISESHQADKGTWYRVRVGRRLDPEAAKDLAAKLGKLSQVFPDKD